MFTPLTPASPGYQNKPMSVAHTETDQVTSVVRWKLPFAIVKSRFQKIERKEEKILLYKKIKTKKIPHPKKLTKL